MDRRSVGEMGRELERRACSSSLWANALQDLTRYPEPKIMVHANSFSSRIPLRSDRWILNVVREGDARNARRLLATPAQLQPQLFILTKMKMTPEQSLIRRPRLVTPEQHTWS